MMATILEQELTVSECHDVYDPVETASMMQMTVPGTQCHDPSPTASIHHCRIVSANSGPVRVIRVVGRLDWATDGEFRDLMRNDCTEASVIIDLSAATSDGAGTGVLLVAAARARRHGQRLAFVITDPLAREVLVSAGLGTGVPIVASDSEALAWFDGRRVGAGVEPAAPAEPAEAATPGWR